MRDLRTGLWWCAVVILLLAAFLWTRLVRYAAAPAHAARPAGRLPLLLLAVLALLQIGYWYTVHLADLRSVPIDSRYADMLPLMRSGFADLDMWRSPYRPHDVPWTLTNYYLPLTFLPYYVAYRCGLDIRYVNLACFVLIDLTLLLLWPRGQSRARQLYFLGCWVAASSALHAVIDAHQLTRIIHLAPYWLYVTVTYALLVLGRPFVSACAALCALAARETAVFHIVPMGVALLSLRPAMARTYLTVIPAGLLAVFLPFFIDNPGFYSGNLAQYSLPNATAGIISSAYPGKFVACSDSGTDTRAPVWYKCSVDNHLRHHGGPCVTTDTVPQTVLFPDLFDKPLFAQFNQEQASSDGGAMFFIGLLSRLLPLLRRAFPRARTIRASTPGTLRSTRCWGG